MQNAWPHLTALAIQICFSSIICRAYNNYPHWLQQKLLWHLMMSLSFLYWLNLQAARCYPHASTETNLISANRELYAIFQSVCQIIWRWFWYWNVMANGNRLTGLSSLKVTIFPSDSFSFNCPWLKNIIKDSKQLRRRYYFQKLKNLSWESICACSFFSCWQILNYLANFLMQNFCLLSKLLHLTWEGFSPSRVM